MLQNEIEGPFTPGVQTHKNQRKTQAFEKCKVSSG